MIEARNDPSASFESALQRALVCRALLSLVGARERWTSTGPAPAARASPSKEEHPDVGRILAACWALWDGCSTLALNELLLLGPRPLEAIGELIAAIGRGPLAIDDWLDRFEPAAGLARGASRLPRRARIGSG